MPSSEKYHQILDAMEKLLKSSDVRTISVTDIAKEAGIGKGSIYYYFSSKNDILEQLIQRNYKKTIENAYKLASQQEISPFERMTSLFLLCQEASMELSRTESSDFWESQENALIHQKYIQYMIASLSPVLTEIIRQGIEQGVIGCKDPSSLAEIVILVFTTELDNTLAPKSTEEIRDTLSAFMELLENGAHIQKGRLRPIGDYFS